MNTCSVDTPGTVSPFPGVVEHRLTLVALEPWKHRWGPQSSDGTLLTLFLARAATQSRAATRSDLAGNPARRCQHASAQRARLRLRRALAFPRDWSALEARGEWIYDRSGTARRLQSRFIAYSGARCPRSGRTPRSSARSMSRCFPRLDWTKQLGSPASGRPQPLSSSRRPRRVGRYYWPFGCSARPTRMVATWAQELLQARLDRRSNDQSN